MSASDSSEDSTSAAEGDMLEAKPDKALARAFVLDTNSEWVTVATGVTVTELSEDGHILTASLHDELDTNTVLFSTSFHQDQEIIRQQATVVTWTLADGSDVALSFENENGCDVFWREVCLFLGRPSEYIPHDGQDTPMSEEDMYTSQRPSGLPLSLPDEIEFGTIPDIDESLEKAVTASPEIRRPLCIALIEGNYVSRLLDLFRIAEDLEARESLHRLYTIFKHLILLNNPAVLRDLLAEQNVFNVAGVFEYDPAYPDTRPGYRQFLLDRNRFKQVLELNNPQLVDLIHQTFRIQYLKDVVLPRILDEETFGSLLFMIRCNFAEIIETFETNDEFLAKLIPLFSSNNEDDCISTLKFMKEFLNVAKASANGRNLKLYHGESFQSFLHFLQRMLAGKSATARSLAVDVLIGVTQHDSQIIRGYMIDRKDNPMEGQLLTAVIDRVRDVETEIGLRWQLVAVLRTLLDAPGLMNLPMPNDEFLNFFYPDYALRLLHPLVELDKVKKANDTETFKVTEMEDDLYFNTCELLCSFIGQHKYRIKYLLFRSFIVHNVLLLFKCHNKILKMCAVRVMRTMLGTGDDFYFRFFMKQALFKPIIEEAINQGTTDNAHSSALIEFFTYIRERKYSTLVAHLVENYREDLEKIRIAPIYKILSDTYAESMGTDQAGHPSSDSGRERLKDTWLDVDRSEEAYFSSANDDDDDEDNEDGQIGLDRSIGWDQETGLEEPHQQQLSLLTADEMDIPHKVATTWLSEDDLDRSKRMKY